MTFGRLVPTRSMSSRRQLVLESIRRHFRVLGQSPSHREIGDATGLSHQHVGKYLVILRDEGLIDFIPKVARSISLIDRGAMLSDCELELICAGRGWTVIKPAVPIAEAFPVDPVVPDYGLHALAILNQID